MNSVEYLALKSSVDALKTDLLNFSVSPTTPYSNADLLKCQAFVVFSHAEMQVYWEAIARRILREAENRWLKTRTIDRVIATLMAFRRPEGVSVPQDPFNPHTNGDFGKIIAQAIKSHNEVISDNNGIKRANISGMLIPLGVLPDEFIEAMLIQLDQTGKRRGEIVHKASSVSLKTVRDPFQDEMQDIYNLIAEIKIFDKFLQDLGLLSSSIVEKRRYINFFNSDIRVIKVNFNDTIPQ
ncbi:hypothetical protein [Asaia bogorensis]|uniref:hypothetical protein n=1 Tax=Asaia bogorensis TaxID=91915 RepID=UPI0028567AAA|nr:hypothetical protein [Asaia bogorensis]MDR6183267.1 hypothetical protein [Asaia bogorensis NBRC 16594]